MGSTRTRNGTDRGDYHALQAFIAGFLAFAAAGIGGGLSAGSAGAQDTIKIGIVVPMTGTSGAVGREISDAVHLYMAQHGDTVAGKKIELIIKDDQSVPDNAKRLAQEMVVNDHVNFLGAGLTPSAMAMAPIATEGKVPTVIMVSGTSVVTEKSPYYVRTSFTLGQQSGIIADWAIRTLAARRSRHDPVRLGAERRGRQGFCGNFTKGGGQVLDTLKVPLADPDFSPFLQRAHDLAAGHAVRLRPRRPGRNVCQAIRRARPGKVRHQARWPGDIVDDDDLPTTGDTLLGVVTAELC